jgi:hypothetical protein
MTRLTLNPAVVALAGVAIGACARQAQVEHFKASDQPRTRVVALAPLANGTGVLDAPAALWEAIYVELGGQQHDYTVAIQTERETRTRIGDAGLSDEAAARLPADELCRVLASDAVLRGTVTAFYRFGIEEPPPDGKPYGTARQSEVMVDLEVYDCTDAAVVWAEKVKQSGGFLSSPAALRERVGAEVAKRFPYRRG